MIFDQFDRIYIVNLRSRPDRREEMQAQLASVGLAQDARVQFFQAIKTDDAGPFARIGSHGAYLSHLEILKSQANKDETVLILQDDCDFAPNVRDISIGTDWDIFYGGYHQLDSGNLEDSGIQGAHCMAFRPATIPLLVDFLEAVYDGSYRPEGDRKADSGRLIAPPIDGAIVWFRRSRPGLRTLFRKISSQRPSRTDIGAPSFVDRFPLIADSLRKLVRGIRRLKQTRGNGKSSPE